MNDKVKNLFISHHGKDDDHIRNLKELLQKRGYTIRNSSVDSLKPNDAKNEEYIKNIIRDGVRWAGLTLVLIGKDTHTRTWVDYEIECSNRAGNRIVGVYIQGNNDGTIPEALEKFGDGLCGWNTDKIIDLIEGEGTDWENPDGTPRTNKYKPERSNC